MHTPTDLHQDTGEEGMGLTPMPGFFIRALSLEIELQMKIDQPYAGVFNVTDHLLPS
ncbi:MAG: hypothetical protein H7A51_20040 [Akkermansiaceae bacterium]|nr:hypothetical protein [Akkermansiaceae bacterium]